MGWTIVASSRAGVCSIPMSVLVPAIPVLFVAVIVPAA
jgi:hypothetical protein